ncbi:HIRAN domain-containing protein [Lactobacillus delbrueckii subsp. bulgaricus]
MEDIFFTVTGCNHYFGTEAFKPRMKVTLYKEPDNKYDKEAIRVEARALGKIGSYTVLGESRSAGDLIDDGATGPGALRPASRAGLRAGRD